ncbi:MAG: hypothetical protein A2X48_14700 [Lentisphaerae bacterium GWF2_49_21]|nr:MAG: hypothetical protein A2X48_14700 [Lentisphaerae bacterium GWF2_49_21]
MNEARSKLVELAVNAAISDEKIKEALETIKGEETKPADDGFMSVKEAMKFLGGISRPHLWKCRRERALPSHMVGERVVFSRKELSGWVLKNGKKN